MPDAPIIPRAAIDAGCALSTTGRGNHPEYRRRIEDIIAAALPHLGMGAGCEDYDASRRSSATLADCMAVVGHRAALTLTGTLVEACETTAGVCVVFEVDDRWGFAPAFRFGMDLECFDVSREEAPDA